MKNKLLMLLLALTPVVNAQENGSVAAIASAVAETAKSVENTAKAVTEATKPKVEPTAQAAKTPVEPKKEQKKAEVVATPKVDYKDAFLGLVLQKAEKYSATMENGLGKAVDMAQTAVSKAVDLAAEEAPILMREFLMWRFIQNLLHFIVPFVLFLISIIVFLKNFPKWIDSFRDDKAGKRSNEWREVDAQQVKNGLAGLVSGVCSLVTIMFVFSSFSYLLVALQIHIAPRVYIIEQAIQLFKK
jgi:hypothetical protein